MNYPEGGQDKSTIECRYFRKNGECKKPGCPYLHRVASVKPKAFKKVFSGQGDNNQQGFQNEQQQQNRPPFNRPQGYQGTRDFTFNRLNQINNTNQYRNQNNNYHSFQQNQRFENTNRPQYQQNQNLQQPTVGIQQLYKMHFENLKGFLPMINIAGQHYFGLISNKSITFILYNEAKGVDLLNKIDFTLQQEIENAFIQEYVLPQQYEIRYCLMVVIAEATLKSILIYPDFLNSQSNFIRVSDVSNTQLKHVRVNINKNELYTFSSDGFIRVFALSNPKSTLKHYLQISEVIMTVNFLNEIINGSVFLLATKQGNIYTYLNNQITKLHTQQNIMDLALDSVCNRVYMVSRSAENNSEIHFLNQNNIIEGPIYSFKFPLTKIQCFQDFDQNNCLLVSDDRGQLDILKEQSQSDQVRFLRQSQHKQNMGEIKRMILFNSINPNKVIERMIFVQRTEDPQRNINQNFEFYRFYQVF